jgi:transcriptional repressor NrdR
VDSVAYVRFASVYREFKDLPEFVRSLEALVGAVKTTGPRAFATQAEAQAPREAAGGTQAPLFPDVTAPAPKKRKEE